MALAGGIGGAARAGMRSGHPGRRPDPCFSRALNPHPGRTHRLSPRQAAREARPASSLLVTGYSLFCSDKPVPEGFATIHQRDQETEEKEPQVWSESRGSAGGGRWRD